ncbi:type I-MYXAN CRISPR-associated protein Cas6/Cmx6 [Gloeobacter morelensis]|uniref:type I-MYXAN CRISPR-associated protein Cas6/Cmx6 n=1 Tax=Gloeobacter morelensis TaxID=2907343 RepID=UPI001E34B755|nr:type I-MYXAN CRISPR-associated protein Cas6/Cmx6 [Gloeobacter morelensis]UFP97188.1 type I-MYXAN CRISPR-associated protein Cas6/Cmx6 [Gloeobacter morelensis MG652769]
MSTTATTAHIVDVVFPLAGSTLPSDHNYLLFSTLSKLLPEVHEAKWLSIAGVSGCKKGANHTIVLTDNSRLVLRLPLARLGEVYPLVGQRLQVGEHSVVSGPPVVQPLTPAPTLYARMVVIKNKGIERCDPLALTWAVRRALGSLNIFNAEVILETESVGGRCVFARRALRVGNTGGVVVGYGLFIAGLNIYDSLLIQAEGIGAKRHFGCGIFIPAGSRVAQEHQIKFTEEEKLWQIPTTIKNLPSDLTRRPPREAWTILPCG